MEHGCNDSPGTFGMFTVDADYQIQQPLAQFFVAQLINLEWAQPGSAEHRVFAAKGDVDDGAGHALVTAYALDRPDGLWSLLIVNRDQQNAHSVRVFFRDEAAHGAASFVGPVRISTFGREQYHWQPAETRFMAHDEHAGERPVVVNTKGFADPDGPIKHAEENTTRETSYELPAASVTVIRGKIAAN